MANSGALSRAGIKQGPRKNATQMDDEARQCFEMRIAGKRYDQIAQILGISISTVTDRLDRGRQMAIVPNVEQLRNEQNAELDAITDRLIADNPIITPQVSAALAQLMKRRADLNGLDRPIQVEVKSTITTPFDERMADLSRELGLNDPTVANA